MRVLPLPSNGLVLSVFDMIYSREAPFKNVSRVWLCLMFGLWEILSQNAGALYVTAGVLLPSPPKSH